MSTITASTTTAYESTRSALWPQLRRRWPSLLAIIAAVSGWGMDVMSARDALVLLPTFYLVNAAVMRRSMTWPLLAAALAIFVTLQARTTVDPARKR